MRGNAGSRGPLFHVKQLRALLINPHIYDFAAYNFWSAPLGLLTMGAILRENGFEVHLVDCMEVPAARRRRDGRGPFAKKKVEKPEALKDVGKPYRRYGLPQGDLEERLLGAPEPDLVLVGTGMTYWYNGAQEAVGTARRLFPAARIVVGGLYPSLCPEHASRALRRADLIVAHRDMERFYRFVEAFSGRSISCRPLIYDMDATPYPCFDLSRDIPFIPLLTSFGCPFRCPYCATSYMHPRMARKSPSRVIDEILYWHGQGVSRFVLYDDSFLAGKDRFAKPLLREVAALDIPLEIYNPNAVNAALMDEELASLLMEAGFQEVRFGLETADEELQRALGGKVTTRDFEKALSWLAAAGFPGSAVHAYILSGLPFQRWQDVRSAVDYAADLGVMVGLAEYTPIPHTEFFERFKGAARYPIEDEPLYQNNALFPFAWKGFTEEHLSSIKARVRALNLQNGAYTEGEDI